MNILITGGLGFIGKHLYNFLKQDKKNTVFVLDHAQHSSPDIPVLCVDLSKAKTISLLKNYINKYNIEVVFHLAAIADVQLSLQDFSLTHNHNLTSTVNLLDAIKETNIKKIIYSSTAAVYGNNNSILAEDSVTTPSNPYGLQKLTCEKYIEMYSYIHNVTAVCLRYFNVFGENMKTTGAYRSVISIFADQKSKNTKLTITGDGKQMRDFVHVDDVVLANYLALISSQTSPFEIYNVGYGKSYTINDIAAAFNHPSLYINTQQECKISACDNTKIKQKLGWNTTQNVVDWILKKY